MSSRREPQRPPRYAGEDTRLTTTRELTGWYAYGLAADVFSVCGVSKFLRLGDIGLEIPFADHGGQPPFFPLFWSSWPENKEFFGLIRQPLALPKPLLAMAMARRIILPWRVYS